MKQKFNHRGHREHGVKEFALVRDANGQLVEDGNSGGSGLKTAAKVGLGAAGAAGGAVLGTRFYHANKVMQEAGGWKKNWSDLGKMSQAGNTQGIMDWQKNMGAAAQNSARQGWMGKLGKVGNVLTKFSANLKPALRELAARSGRIVEFGDGGADEAVLGALKAVASADESPAQRAMLLKQGLIDMVAGQVVITERGYEMMQKAGMPPKLTPEERREEIAGTEEKRLSRFNHGEHGGHGVELARGDFAIPAMKKILNSSPADRRLHEFPGLVGALRGDSAKMQAHYAALGKRNKHYASMAEGAASPGVLRHLRSWAAGAIRESRNA